MRKILFYLMMICFSWHSYGQILSEGFESGTFPPSGWAAFIGTNGLGTGQNWKAAGPAYQGSSAAFVRYESTTGVNEDWLVTPAIDLSAYENAELTFWTRQDFSPDWDSEYYVMVSTTSQTDHASFTEVASWDETTINTTYNIYEQKTVDLSAYDGQTIYVAFLFVNDDGDSWYVDNVVVTGDGGGTTDPEYCIPEGINTARYINNFTATGNTDSVSNLGSGFSTGGYGDYFDIHTVSQAPDGTVSITSDVMGGTAGFRIWVDWNQDGQFDTTEEVAYNSTGYLSHHEGSFTVPSDAITGETRMRVVSHWLSSTGDISPCATGFNYGEFEDYKFVVEGGTTDPEYCIPEGINTARYINNFTATGNTDSVSNLGSGFSTGGYGDYFDIHTVSQAPDGTVSITSDVMGGTAGFRIWVDWNQDGQFDTTEEVAYNSTGYLSHHEGSFTVPSDATFGETRMRVVSHWLSTTGNVDPCATGFNYGEFEDYKFVVEEEEVPTGCLTGTLYPSTAFTPACYGSPQVITTIGWAGEYSNVNVVAGTEYIFSSSIDTDFITIANTGGTSVYASGTGSVTWTATANEVVRFYTHVDADCTTQSVSRSRIVQCGSPIEFEDPAFDCFFGDGGLSGLENGYGVNPTDIYRVADDFTIEAETTFTVQQIILNVLTASDISSATINIREDNAGTPGDVVETVTMAPTSSTVFGTAFSFNALRLVFDLAETFELTEGTYWLEPTISNTGGTSVYWEVTTLGSTGAPLQASNTSGTSWVPDDSGFDYNAVFYIAGECESVTEEEGCLDAPSGQYPSTTFVPSCIGVVESITTAAWTGEYSLVQVTAGVEYTFSSSITTDFVTIADENGTVSYAAGTGSVTWTATADEVVRFYLHLDDECNSINSGLRSRLVQCGEVPPAPANDECEDAIALACGESDSGTTFGANNSGGGTGADVFYSFTGDGTEQLVTVSLCGSSFDTYLRIFSDCTLTNEIAFNDDSCGLQSELSFLSDGTSTYIILVEGWSTNVGDYTINITCEDAPEAPENCEDFVVPSNNLENGLFFEGDTAQHLAADIPVGENGFTIYGVTPTVIDYATTFEFTFYEDAGGLPGAVFAERTGTIFGSEVTGNNFGYDFVKYQVTFEALTFEPNTRYWMEIESDALAWESNSAQFMPLGAPDVFYNVNVGEGVWTSTGGDEFVFELICEELGVSDMTSFDFAYYPNPVKDVLNINAKKGVESVSAFNLAGQQVIKDAKVSNGQIDVNSLTPGTYVFRVTLEGGQVETFKIIKK